MNYNKFQLFFIFMSCIFSYSQVGITKKNTIEIHEHAILQIDGQYNGDNYGLMLPAITKEEYLPLYSSSEPDDYENDPTMKGNIMFNTTYSTFHVYDGDKWQNEWRNNTNFKANKARFTTNGNEERSVTCGSIVVVIVCGRHEPLDFSKEVYNNLGIIKRDGRTTSSSGDRTRANSEFAITQDGIYKIDISIPSKTVGVLSLTGDPQYQLYLYKQNSSINSTSETKLLTFLPDAYSVLGFGGDANTAAFATTTVRLQAGDSLVLRIHSPLAGVGLGNSLTAKDNSIISNNYAREILFTKISD
ncbi:hypothetical protein IF125_13935 [Empedobacter stercoris]|uniref:hypothetical protein n=1 Tax=Empedobacter stercoris TaxID=1628248 RepID=UPI001CE192E7|nr:hypothetical protein [Empedobacter stercoris]MCA4783335.1 hypothetical protein [Empedobacter stercoris]